MSSQNFGDILRQQVLLRWIWVIVLGKYIENQGSYCTVFVELGACLYRRLFIDFGLNSWVATLLFRFLTVAS